MALESLDDGSETMPTVRQLSGWTVAPKHGMRKDRSSLRGIFGRLLKQLHVARPHWPSLFGTFRRLIVGALILNRSSLLEVI